MIETELETVNDDNFIRKQAEHAQKLQMTISQGQALEKWVSDGNWQFLEENVFKMLEKKAFQTIKAPEFDPANVSQVAQLKALCQTMDLIRADINSQVWAVTDARAQLNDLQNSTLKESE